MSNVALIITDSLTVDDANKKINLVSTQTVHLHRLLSFTNYHIEIAGCTRAGCGVFSSPVSLRTSEYLASEPLDLHFPFVNLTSVRLAWTSPKNPNGVLIYILRDEDLIYIYIFYFKTFISSYKTARISVHIRHLFIESECLLIGCVSYISLVNKS